MFRSLAFLVLVFVVACGGASSQVVVRHDESRCHGWNNWLVVDFEAPAVVAVAPACEVRLKEIDQSRGVFSFPSWLGNGAYRVLIVQGHEVLAMAVSDGKTIPLKGHVGEGKNAVQEVAGVKGVMVLLDQLPDDEPLPPLRLE